MTVAVKSFGSLQSTTYRKISIKAKFYRSTIYLHTSLHYYDYCFETLWYHWTESLSSLPCYNNIKVLLKVVDKFRRLLLGTLRIDIEYFLTLGPVWALWRVDCPLLVTGDLRGLGLGAHTRALYRLVNLYHRGGLRQERVSLYWRHVL